MIRGAGISTFSVFFRRLDLTRRPYLPAIAVSLLLFILNGFLQPKTLRLVAIVADISTYLPLILLAVGQTYVVLASDIDLSVGSIISLANVVTVSVMALQASLSECWSELCAAHLMVFAWPY
jgi:ribose/xylose/arabinose/galactoside ABC-type transport system permease subunit